MAQSPSLALTRGEIEDARRRSLTFAPRTGNWFRCNQIARLPLLKPAQVDRVRSQVWPSRGESLIKFKAERPERKQGMFHDFCCPYCSRFYRNLRSGWKHCGSCYRVFQVP